MSDAASLHAILGRVRRRLRLLAAAQGAVVAGSLAMIGLALAFAVLRWRGAATGAALAGGGAALLAAVGLGALLAASRPIPAARCARIIDQTLGGGDRVLSALFFAADESTSARRSPLIAAAIADAVRRSAVMAPAMVAPFRRPAGVPALGLGAILVALAALVPLPARGSRARASLPPESTPARAPWVRLEASALDPEREEAGLALQAAAADDDALLAKLARELATTVGALGGRGLARGEALDRLAELQRRSEEAAAEAERLERSLTKAGKALQDGAATREAGRALAAESPAATEKAMAELAARAAQASAAERNKIAGALDRAGEQARAAGEAAQPNAAAGSARDTEPRTKPGANDGTTTAAKGAGDAQGPTTGQEAGQKNAQAGEGEERQRRLSRDGRQASSPGAPAAGAPAANHERQLQRLDQDLKEAAAACRDDPESCRRQLDQQSHDLPRMEQQARTAESRRRLSQAVRQLRERLRRGGDDQRARQRAERKFMRAARGEATPEEGASADGDGHADGAEPIAAQEQAEEREPPEGGDPTGAAAERKGAATSPAAGSEAGQTPSPEASTGGQPSRGQPGDGQEGANGAPGDGIGDQSGGDPLGQRGALTARGHDQEARLRGSSGPKRSQVIAAAAERGFAHSTYRSVFQDYHAAVEESLDASDVPPGRRYIVRRYFQLIRPR